MDQLEYTAPAGFRLLDLLAARVGAQAGLATVLAARVGAQAVFATVLVARIGAQAGFTSGLGFVLAFRVEKQNIGSPTNRNPVRVPYIPTDPGIRPVPNATAVCELLASKTKTEVVI